jgi:transposase-like protein
MVERDGQVVIRMLSDVQQKTITPLIQRTIARGSTVYTDEDNIYARLTESGDEHQTANHGARRYARDDDGDGKCEVHVNTIEGFWSAAAFVVTTTSRDFTGKPSAVSGLL